MATLVGGPARLWTGASEGFQVRLFRKAFKLSERPARAVLEIFAEQRYHVWINGVYLGRGPCLHHPDQFPVDVYEDELKAHLVEGRNVLAVLVQSAGHTMHNRVYSGEPGLIAQLSLEHSAGQQERIVTDDTWRVSDDAGWRVHTVRRSWAIDSVEQFDQANAPGDWQGVEFDDSRWASAIPIMPATSITTATFFPRPVPNLVRQEVHPTAFLGQYRIDAPPLADDQFKSSGELGRSIMEAKWMPVEASLPLRDFTVVGHGTVACFDLGREVVGQYVIECDCPGAGVIDIGWSEVVENGRPPIVRKGVGYLDRIRPTGGTIRFEPIQFSAMRYLVLVVRGFVGPVRVKQFFVRATEPALNWSGSFDSSDEQLNRIFDLCERSHRVGTQEAIMDCPSREQAAYVGDGMPVGRWITQLTGDDRHWRYLVRAQWHRQSPQGLVRSSIFSGSNDTLIDYTLLGVVGTRAYVNYANDLDLARELIEPCRRAVGYFDGFRKDDLCAWTLAKVAGREWEQVYDPAPPSFGTPASMNLFIDHPGLGWHNKNEAGIDRRGVNAALNGFYVLAKRALADLEERLGNRAAADQLRAEAEATARAMHRAFYDPARRVFVDGILDGQRLEQVSEQTNTLAVAAGCLPDDQAKELLSRLISSDDPTVARNGPYFWTYLFPELSRLGLHELALRKGRALWSRMLAGGATTLWETFLGDDLDSWCHPWSAAIQEFLQTAILGLPGVDFDPHAVTLRPRIDLLPEARGAIHTRLGRFDIDWRREGGRLTVTGTVPPGVTATLVDPGGALRQRVEGPFRVSV